MSHSGSRNQDCGGVTLEFVLMSIVPIAVILLFYMIAVFIGTIKATDEAAKEAARTLGRYADLVGEIKAKERAETLASEAFSAKAPPQAKIQKIEITTVKAPSDINTYETYVVHIISEAYAPFVRLWTFDRTYSFPTEYKKKKEALW